MLKLKSLQLTGNSESQAALEFSVVHNVGLLPTTLTQDLSITLEPLTGAVECALQLSDLKAENIEEARKKMAVWCDRMAAALRYTEKVEADLPFYERKTFHVNNLPKWLQAEFHRIVEALTLADDPSDLVQDLINDGHPLVYVPDAIDVARTIAGG